MSFRPTYSGVVASLALFVALGGGAYAATALPANSVGAKQVKKGAIERAKLKDNAVDGSKVLDNSLTGDDIKESTLDKVPSAALADTATNATNTGHALSAAGVDRVIYRSSAGVTSGGVDTGVANCDPGQHVVGGGVSISSPNAFDGDTYPSPGATGWTVHVAGDPGIGFTTYAICVVSPAAG